MSVVETSSSYLGAVTRRRRNGQITKTKRHQFVWHGLTNDDEEDFFSSNVTFSEPFLDVVTLIQVAVDIMTLSDSTWDFQRLIKEWHKERGVTSSTTKIAMCPSYQRIIAKGPEVVPVILRQLEKEGDEPDHWFWALTVLTDADPVPDEARGDIVKMSRAWLDWGRQRYAW